ncbi:phosphate transport regulator [Pedobacter ginsengisoli]|uniref:Phosphate transport regulator n=1 Tax=Pedobacter ginsengisoli TaxID=363852 RepID=A0A2D1UAY0_9SPHI|nr:DUF47 family protein [Pedobacter ginsengisoli]ATP58782.1 phosphate transport regulator [Pedobacter ginsengisoli]
MNNVLKFFIPPDKKFQPLFEQSGKNLISISETLLLALSTNDLDQRNKHIKKIEQLERNVNKIRHAVFLGLSKSIITPFSREDIHTLISAVYDISDYIRAAAISIEMYNILQLDKTMIKLANLLTEMCKDLDSALKELRSFKNKTVISDVCLRIYKGESKADKLCNHAVAGLFKTELNPIELIKQKELLQTLEMATDRCDDAANALEAILVKNS